MRAWQLQEALYPRSPAPAVEAPGPSADSQDPPPKHWLRVWGRRGLRLFRPLALPLLHRLEWRVRTAVDKSEFAAAADRRLHGLEERAAALDASLTRGIADTNQTLTELRAMLTEQSRQAAASHQEATAHVTAHVTARLDNLLRDMIGASRWGAVVRLAEGEYLVRAPLGWLVVPGEDERLLMAMIETGGVLEPGTQAVLMALLRPGDTMIDVGAHIGTLTLPAARAVGPSGRVIAIEPGGRASALLRRSLHINSLTDTVTVHDCAAGAASGEAMLHLAPVIGENSLVLHSGETGASVRVAVRPLDELVPAGPVRVVKIDAEGYELEVRKGMRRIIADNPELAVIVEFGPTHLARAGIPISEWIETLRAPGFTPWEIDEASGTIRALRSPDECAAIFSINVLLLRTPPSACPGLRVA
jgi:FkbM family methyltransferase